MAPLLGYWDVRGLGNSIRYLLNHVGVEFEDKLYKCGPPPNFDRSEWLNEKFTLGLDFPNLPYYIDEDVKLSQSGAILRYLAGKHGLNGKNLVDQARVDLLAAQVTDFHMDFVRIVYNPDYSNLKADYLKGLPEKLEKLVKFLGDRKFVAGDYVTFADFVFFEYLEGQSYFAKDLLKDYPVLEQYHQRVLALDGVDKYFKSAKAIKYPFNGAPAFFGGAYSDQLAASSK